MILKACRYFSVHCIPAAIGNICPSSSFHFTIHSRNHHQIVEMIMVSGLWLMQAIKLCQNNLMFTLERGAEQSGSYKSTCKMGNAEATSDMSSFLSISLLYLMIYLFLVNVEDKSKEEGSACSTIPPAADGDHADCPESATSSNNVPWSMIIFPSPLSNCSSSSPPQSIIFFILPLHCLWS